MKISLLQNMAYEALDQLSFLLSQKRGTRYINKGRPLSDARSEGIVKDDNPDIIAFSVMTGSHHWPIIGLGNLREVLK